MTGVQTCALPISFNGLLKAYEKSLDWVLGHHAGAVLALLFITMALNVVYIVRMPKGFFPQQDTGVVMGGMMGPQDASFQMMNGTLRRAVSIVRSDPGVKNVVGFTGGQGASNSAFMFIALKPLDQRHATATDIVNRLRPRLMTIQHAQVFLMAAQDIRIGVNRIRNINTRCRRIQWMT